MNGNPQEGGWGTQLSFARAGSHIKGAFHSIKNPGLKFRKLHVANGTVNREICRLVVPARLDGTVSIQFRTKISRNVRQRGTANRFFSNGIVIPIRKVRPKRKQKKKSGPPRKVDLLSRMESARSLNHNLFIQ